jgi:cytochrome b6-f complex iron-sulfur subunit
MPLIDDLKMPLSDEEHDRRKFLGLLGAGAMAVAAIGTGITSVRFLWPEVLFEADTRFRLGRPEEIPAGTLLVLSEQKAFVVHGAEGFYAMSAVCTHLGCLTRYEREHNRILCPCHGSRFSTDGRVVEGPAPSALPRLQLTLEQGLLVLDVSKVVEMDAVLKV